MFVVKILLIVAPESEPVTDVNGVPLAVTVPGPEVSVKVVLVVVVAEALSTTVPGVVGVLGIIDEIVVPAGIALGIVEVTGVPTTRPLVLATLTFVLPFVKVPAKVRLFRATIGPTGAVMLMVPPAADSPGVLLN